ncbi:TonB-dependent receptor plug domain-containing protein [Robiginitalea sp. IMCC44478]|uniref:TonB-dependent receptor plug domain-containing protein n=1 Tax=Robiginitalea sp. IMCC44478 TaxID=3459122 RepID=UPI00404272D3
MKIKQLLAAVALLMGILVRAQQTQDSVPVQQLEGVVVSDSRFPLERGQSGKTVISLQRDYLDQFPGVSVARILNNQSGFEISGSRGRPGEVLGVFARGGRGRQVLVLIDGIRVSDPSSFSQEYDLRLLNADAVESIEIVKGASSVLYGTNAATAVINIKTRKAGKKSFEVLAGTTFGTQNTSEESDLDLGNFTQNALLSGSLQGFDYRLSFSNSFSNGLSSLADTAGEPDPNTNSSADLNLGFEIFGKNEIRVFANQTRLRSAYDDSFLQQDAPYLFVTDQERLGLSYIRKGTFGSIEAKTAYTVFDSENRSNFPSLFKGNNWFGDIALKRTFGANFQALAGLMYVEDRAELEQDKRFSLLDPYLNLVWTSPGGFNLNTGARLNLHSEYGSQAVYTINPSFIQKYGYGSLKLLASWATAYITPSLTQLFGAFGANPDLQPETNRTFEIGLESQWVKGPRLSLLFFDREEDQTVLFDNNAFLYFNAANPISVQGLETELQWGLSAHLQLSANYTYTERKGDNAIRIPKHKANVLLSAEVAQGSNLTVEYSYTGKRRDTDFATAANVELQAFSLLGLRFSQQLVKERLRANLALTNILNESYTEVLGFTTPGRNLALGLQFKL